MYRNLNLVHRVRDSSTSIVMAIFLVMTLIMSVASFWSHGSVYIVDLMNEFFVVLLSLYPAIYFSVSYSAWVKLKMCHVISEVFFIVLIMHSYLKDQVGMDIVLLIFGTISYVSAYFLYDDNGLPSNMENFSYVPAINEAAPQELYVSVPIHNIPYPKL